MKLRIALLAGAALLAACAEKADAPAANHAAPPSTAGVFVQLFEWRWPDIATECEAFLGPAGYAAVQVSPPNEHVPGPEWWTRYQPVSYRLQSRSGNREQFADMVQRCRAAGVGIYADAVINHMAMVGTGSGIAGSEYSVYSYPVPYSYDDFHHCGRNGDDTIKNYQDLWEVQNCELSTLADLATEKPDVQASIAAYLNELLSLGVAGFRIDAAKHMAHDDIAGILARLESDAHVYQEVIDRGGEPIDAHDYLDNGPVSEFKYPMALLDAFTNGRLDGLHDLASRPGFLPPDKAIVFVDNHDIQRGHAGAHDVLNYKSGNAYRLANVFMLAWPYGQPMVMSGYRFENGDQGPPASAPIDSGTCSADWVCEHRFAEIASMVRFRNSVNGTAVTHWQALRPSAIAFGRGDRGFVILNAGSDELTASVETGMQAGAYCNVLADCDATLHVGKDGVLTHTLAPMSAIAIHVNSKLD